MILTIIVFLIVLGILVLAHEFGHFIVAKKVGVKVEEFAIGFPPRLFSKKIGETEYSINAIPLGGYNKLLGELEHSNNKRAFENQKPAKRFWISMAGVIMNFILAWVLLTIGFSIGMSPLVSSPDQIPGKKLSSEIIVADVNSDSPAAKADLKSGDIIISAKVNETTVNFNGTTDLINFDEAHKGETVTYTIDRDGSIITKEVKLNDNNQSQLGVSMIEKADIRVPWYRAPYIALVETYKIAKLTFEFLGSFFTKLFTHGQFSEEVGGPVAIYTYTGLALKAGFMVLLQFVALLSINLGLINILPFPALDGGRIVFIALEKVYGKRIVREQVENVIHTIGFVLLIAFIVAITYKDIIRLFHK